MPSSAYDVSFHDTFELEATPEELWAALKRTDLFHEWWHWIRHVRMEGEPLTLGSRIYFGIDPPVAYEMKVWVHVTRSRPPHHIEGEVGGDLHGSARLSFQPTRGATVAEVAWDVELASRSIRRVIRVARPLLVWAQHWAVEVSLRGFRRYLADERRHAAG